MALRFCDSFDHYATADIAKKWTTITSSPVIGATGRNSTNGCRLNGNGTGIGKTLGAQATWIIGFSIKTNTLLTNTTGFLRFLDGATLHVDFRFQASGEIIVTRNGTTLGTLTTIISTGVEYYFEAKVTISDTVGVVEVQINGAPETITFVTGTASTQDTRNGGNASANIVDLRGNTATWDIDDLYICDATGGTNDDFLGDVRVQAIFPNGNGNSSQLVGSDGNSTDNYLLVDEATPSTADYVESSTPGDKDTYAFGNLTPTSGTVYGLQVLPYAAKTDAGVRSIVSVARLSGTEVDSAVATLSTTATYYPDIRETKPGGGAWSVSDVNGAEFGGKINA